MSPAVPHGSAVPSRTRIYGGAFWLAYVANLSLVTANALTFRFAEFVQFLGGSEAVAGTVISAGLVGVLAARFIVGPAIDRYGVRRLWIVSSIVFLCGAALFPACRSISVLIFAGRLLFAIGIAGMFTCSIVHIQNLVPPDRRTEVIGNLGSSGFVGMVFGAQLGDVILHRIPPSRLRYDVLFGGTLLFAAVYLVLVVLLTRRDRHVPPVQTPASFRLLRRYWPGNVVLVAVMMGVGITVTTVFLTRYATHLGMPHAFGTFFTGYAASAFLFRIGAQNWSKTMGRHRMILLGLAGHFCGHLMLPLVSQPWHFLFPALTCGFGHALLFPAVVSLGAGAFPRAYRGTGTALVLGFVDLGTGFSAPLLGGIIDHFDGAGFTPMFLTSSATALAIALWYGLTTARCPDHDGAPAEEPIPLRPIAVATTPQSAPVPLPQLGRSA